MKHQLIIGILSAIIVFGAPMSGMAMSNTFEGVIEGFTCMTSGKVCPVDRLDPHLAIEKNFVLQGKENSYHLIPNIDRAVLARNLHMKARVTGAENSKYKTITAEKFEVFTKGTWKEIWSAKREQEEWEKARWNDR